MKDTISVLVGRHFAHVICQTCIPWDTTWIQKESTIDMVFSLKQQHKYLKQRQHLCIAFNQLTKVWSARVSLQNIGYPTSEDVCIFSGFIQYNGCSLGSIQSYIVQLLQIFSTFSFLYQLEDDVNPHRRNKEKHIFKQRLCCVICRCCWPDCVYLEALQ